jgi:hypothetical protein
LPKIPPDCVATAEFVEGPLRRKIDVTGMMKAEKRNLNNDCSYHRRFRPKAREIKNWLLWRLNDGSTAKVEETTLTSYAVTDESKQIEEERGRRAKKEKGSPEKKGRKQGILLERDNKGKHGASDSKGEGPGKNGDAGDGD